MSLEQRLRADGGLKWGYYPDDVLPAWVAEMDFGLAPAVQEALHDAVERGLTGYHYPAAEEWAAIAASAFWEEWLGWRVDPTWVYPAPDVIEGIARAIRLLTTPGSPVVLHSPVYFPFYSMVERAGREVVEVQCDSDEAGLFSLNLDGIDDALGDGAGADGLCNPWNPTGRVLTEMELADLIEVATRHDARLLADEIHAPIVYSGHSHVPAATLDPERVVTVASASKAWNLPGLKCAQVVLTNEADRARWDDHFTPDKVGVGTFGLIANAAAYQSGTEWFSRVLGKLESNRDLVVGLIAQDLPKVVCSAPQGTYLAWLDFDAYDLDDPAGFLLETARVALTAGLPFGKGAGHYARFNFATDRTLLVEMVGRMAEALAGR